jgi:hypothetical protein
MASQAGHGDELGAAPGPDLGSPERDSQLSGFASGGEWDACSPSASLALALEGASGPEWRCAGATRDEMFGLLRQWQALEARPWPGSSVSCGRSFGTMTRQARESDFEHATPYDKGGRTCALQRGCAQPRVPSG